MDRWIVSRNLEIFIAQPSAGSSSRRMRALIQGTAVKDGREGPRREASVVRFLILI